MFTQKVSMSCTKEQYEKYLKDELEKMGYDNTPSDLPIIVNDLNGGNGCCGSAFEERKTLDGRTYLGSFNAPLFLALAAMTDDYGYGEWSVLKSGAFVRRQEDGKGYCYENGGIVKGGKMVEDGARFRDIKASAEEIMAHFAQAIPIHKGDVTFDIKLDTTGIDEILDQFSKRFETKIKEETLSAYLDKVIKDLEEMLKAEPKHKEPIVGEMAIFWFTHKENAICSIFLDKEDGVYFDSSENEYDHAILYESPEQYKSFLKS